MSVSDGQIADQATYNNAFLSRTAAQTNTVSLVDLDNAVAASGPSVVNIQKENNSLNSFTGRVSGSLFNAIPIWTMNHVGTAGDNLFNRSEALTGKFLGTGGHTHNGVNGNGDKISATNLVDINQLFSQYQEFSLAVTGTTSDVSAALPGKVSSDGTVMGVVTSQPHNKSALFDSNGTNIEDSEGQRVYGRITEAGAVWTLSFYTLEAGVETAHSISAQTVRVVFVEIFNLATRPTLGVDILAVQSLDFTADIVDASGIQRGIVSTGVQNFAGNKTFLGDVNIDGTTRIDTAITGVIKASGGTLSASNVDLAAEVTGILPILNGGTGSGTQNFVDLTTPQTVAGDKSFTGNIVHALKTSFTQGIDNVSSGADVDLVSPVVSYLSITSAVTSLRSIVSGLNGQVFILTNNSGGSITIKNEDVAAAAANRIVTGSAADLPLANEANLIFVYDNGSSRWRIIGGGGGGAGGGALVATGTRASPENIIAGTGISFTGTDARQVWFIQGNAAGLNDVTANPQISSGVTLGQELVLIGRSNTNTVLLEDGNGLSLNGSYEMAQDSVLYLFWDSVNWVETSRRE